MAGIEGPEEDIGTETLVFANITECWCSHNEPVTARAPVSMVDSRSHYQKKNNKTVFTRILNILDHNLRSIVACGSFPCQAFQPG